MIYDAIILGAGAAGLMCAMAAGRRGVKALVLEHNARAGQKILISGGGRCNFTNRTAGPENYISSNPHFCKSALARYRPAEFIGLVEKHGIAYHERKHGQLFCDISSKQILDMLLWECGRTQTEVKAGVKVGSVEKHDYFQLRTSAGEFQSRALVVATGALSFPKLGSTDFGYRLAEQFGLKLITPRPGLVPLTFAMDFADLSGIALECSVQARAVSFRENILFTHRGLSGPAILQASNYLVPGDDLVVDLLPDHPGMELFERHLNDSRELQNVLCDYLPRRFVLTWAGKDFPTRPVSRLQKKQLEQIATRLHQWRLPIQGTEGYPKAEVTIGGVDTRDLSSKTMEATKVPGLFFIGEVVDVTGWLGGYNFQWAWASGTACAQGLPASVTLSAT